MRIDCHKLKKARKRSGLTLTEVSRMTGIPRTVIGRWEKGERSPFESFRESYPVREMLEIYGIVIEDLYFDKDIERLNKAYDCFELEKCRAR